MLESFSSIPAGYMAGVWVALEDIDMDNGPLVYYPGSHKLAQMTMQDVGKGSGRDAYPHYEDFVGDLIEQHSLQPEYGTIEKGKALVWSANLLHGGAPQRDMNRSRNSQVTHFFFEDCKYYTPLLSDDEEVFWRDPEWIS